MPNILYFPLYSPFSPEYIVFFPFSLILVLFSTFSETGMEKLYLVLVFVFINIVLGNLSLTYITVDTTIKGEFTQNGFKNDLKHEPGVLSMARTMMPNSAGSQFFIMHQTSPHLDGQYAAFGKVIEGIEVVNKIADVATDRMDKPLEPQVMKKVTVETFGVDYPEPEKC